VKRIFLLILLIFITRGNLFSQTKNLLDYNGLIRLAKKENKTIILFFGADWCIPCKNIIAEVNTFSADYKFLYNNSYYYYVDNDSFESTEILERFSVNTLPSTIILNPKSGKFVLKIGSLSLRNLDESVNKLLQNSEFEK
jgi:thiol-disulfide isomerase/thioredoxin